MSIIREIALLESSFGAPLPKEYRTILAAHRAGFVLRKRYKSAAWESELRFFLGFNEGVYDIRKVIVDLQSWSKGQRLPIIMDMSGQFICLQMKGPAYGEVVRSEGYLGHPDDDVRFQFVCVKFEHFWDSLEDIDNVVEDLIEWLGHNGSPADCEKKLSGLDINSRSVRGYTLLETAAFNNNLPVVNWCLSKGAAVGGAMSDAFFGGAWDILERLLSAGYGLHRDDVDKRRGVPVVNAKWGLSQDSRKRFESYLSRAEKNGQSRGRP